MAHDAIGSVRYDADVPAGRRRQVQAREGFGEWPAFGKSSHLWDRIGGTAAWREKDGSVNWQNPSIPTFHRQFDDASSMTAAIYSLRFVARDDHCADAKAF
jgi:hypothetical protein